jgi:hypothetical protein
MRSLSSANSKGSTGPRLVVAGPPVMRPYFGKVKTSVATRSANLDSGTSTEAARGYGPRKDTSVCEEIRQSAASADRTTRS